MKNKINPQKLYRASFSRFELRLPEQCIIDCSHSGQCDADVAHWAPKIREQIERDNFPNRPTPEKIRADLAEYGAWDAAELSDDSENFDRLVWIAASNIAEDDEPDYSSPA